MQNSSSFKQAFLKNMLLGLQLSGRLTKATGFLERKRVVRLSANIAMAIARDGTNWSRALIASISKEEENKVLIRSIMGEQYERLTKPHFKRKIPRSKMVLTKSHGFYTRGTKGVPARTLARSLLKKRTQVLKRLVPGGRYLDDSSLLDETLDYVVCLQAQVDLMWLLTKALEV